VGLLQEGDFIGQAGVLDDDFQVDALLVGGRSHHLRQAFPIHRAGEGDFMLVVMRAIVVVQMDCDSGAPLTRSRCSKPSPPRLACPAS